MRKIYVLTGKRGGYGAIKKMLKALDENKYLKDGLNVDKKEVPNHFVREALDSLLN